MRNRQAAMGFIFITIVLDVTGIGIIIPVLPDLIKELIHGTNADAAEWGGWLLTAYALMQFIFAPMVGALSDQYGRRPVLLLSLLGFALDFILLAIAPTIGWLFIGRIIAGIMGASVTTAAAYISDISNEQNRAQNFGLLGAAFGIGFIIGPVAGGLLGDINLRLPFWVAAGITFLNAAYGYFVLPESLSKEHRKPYSWKNANPVGNILQFRHLPLVVGMMLCYFLYQTAAHSVHSIWNFYTKEKFEWSKTLVGISLGVVGILVGLVQGVLTKPINRWLGNAKSLYWGLGMFVIGTALFGLASEGWMMFVFLVPYCIGGIAGPAFQSIITVQAPKNQQGALQGALTGTLSLANIIGPFIMTHVFAYFSQKDTSYYFPGAPFTLGSFLFGMSWLVAAMYIKKNRI